MREHVDTDKLAALATSIAAVGVIEPLIVRPRGARYEILAGHRRYLAATIAQLATVPCLVRLGVGELGEAITLHENVEREDLQPVEEARWFAQLCDRLGGDTDAVAARVKRPRVYVETKLALLDSDPELVAALESRQITQAVALELRKLPDRGARLHYLDAAISGGATAAIVARWRKDWQLVHATAAGAVPPTIAGEPAAATPLESFTPTCFYCADSDEVHTMDVVYIHRRCLKSLRKVAGAAIAGEPAL